MKATTFRLIDAINREGLDNSHWGVVEDIESTKEYFGTDLDEQLHGQYIYIYVGDEDKLLFLQEALVIPNKILFIDWASRILFFKV